MSFSNPTPSTAAAGSAARPYQLGIPLQRDQVRAYFRSRPDRYRPFGKSDALLALAVAVLLFNPFVVLMLADAVPLLPMSASYVEALRPRPAPLGWKNLGAAAGDEPHRIMFAVKQSNVPELERTLMAVSDPRSPRYGQHLSFADVNNLVRPQQARIAAVRSFIASAFPGVAFAESAAQDFVTLEAPRSQVESVFQVQFANFVHLATGVTAVRTVDTYSVPAELASHLDFVGGFHRFPDVSRISNAKNLVKADGDLLGATPSSLRKLYNVTDAIGTAANNSQCVTAFLKQHFLKADYDEFNRLYNRDNVGFDIAKVVGPDTAPSGIEAELDVQYVTSVAASHIKTWFWSVAGTTAGQEPFLEWVQEVANTSQVPWTFSTSYGDDENSLDVDYMQRVNTEFAKMGARGLSLFFASGDSGVGGAGVSCSRFVPSFPASSPYVTTVGGTALPLTDSDEHTASLSGGGFSDVFPRPDYQSAAVNSYLSSAPSLPAASYYNGTGRAYPDVAALAEGFVVVSNLIVTPGIAGTSCASPTFTSVVSKVNDVRLNANKSPLGFLNPLIYTLLPQAGALHDIVKGNNPGCGTPGFQATVGWDPTSGFGSPNYGLFAQLALSL
ncbi:tripeptidyl-peptidase I [Capsaspora owczarzaki ATCC 30864]|uniref:Tripeptidyl-peptidase I n=1 Tax=Capsaspora owczarzaki (strain ATCC 30864) TaxID=595528 RepID=A0A0D2X1V4_CAPO3|nr:tripeptidyl-peptidase I [Capsaspora owczarzaki ATCC 30864]KJE91464.1 tripeptidyl-peptidase I [Capsaspora owczarzaki ATCC 30864]|eukprot:XP_004349344.1 tripeptidyl-peptidase I [Capsaspora owczarzaki ATCC 30864]